MEQKDILAKKNFRAISDKVNKVYDNFILENINDHCMRMAVIQNEYNWHYHQHTDELFVVLEGELKIEIKNSDTVLLKPGEFMKIPAGTIHKTSATIRTVNILLKAADDTIFVDQIGG